MDRIRGDMCLTENKIEARLYKLLLYKTGGHFAAHRDTEKERGMFGTLLVQLPSVYSGGTLILRHGGSTKSIHMVSTGHPMIFFCLFLIGLFIVVLAVIIGEGCDGEFGVCSILF